MNITRTTIIFFFLAIFMWACSQKTVKKNKKNYPITIHFKNEVNVSAELFDYLKKQFQIWGDRVYKYNQVEGDHPVNAILTDRYGIGTYIHPNVYIPISNRRRESVVEDWVHELAHHAVGSKSNFFFKEGIAVHTVEVLYLQQGKMPQGWPQYGQTNDAWVNLFLVKNKMPSLQKAIDWPRYFAETSEGDCRSWQIYIIGGSFVGWYISQYGYKAFKNAFDKRKTHLPAKELEKKWLHFIKEKNLPLFDSAAQLPARPRYHFFSRWLNSKE